jgi:hypothetical protein
MDRVTAFGLFAVNCEMMVSYALDARDLEPYLGSPREGGGGPEPQARAYAGDDSPAFGGLGLPADVLLQRYVVCGTLHRAFEKLDDG